MPVGHTLDKPPGDSAKNAQNHGHDDAQPQNAGHIQCHTDTAENLANAGQTPENLHVAGVAPVHIPFLGHHGQNLAYQFGVTHPGGIYHPAIAKEHIENLVFKAVPLVSHVHPLVEDDSAALLLVD